MLFQARPAGSPRIFSGGTLAVGDFVDRKPLLLKELGPRPAWSMIFVDLWCFDRRKNVYSRFTKSYSDLYRDRGASNSKVSPFSSRVLVTGVSLPVLVALRIRYLLN